MFSATKIMPFALVADRKMFGAEVATSSGIRFAEAYLSRLPAVG